MSGNERGESCRICRKVNPIEESLLIFDNTCTRILEEIKQISEVDFRGIFEQPWVICMQCYTDLSTAQRFRTNCIEAHEDWIKVKQFENVLPDDELLEKVPETLPDILLAETPSNNALTDEDDEPRVCARAHSPEVASQSKSCNELDPVKPSRVCEICGNTYQSKRSFAQHIRRHTNNKPFQCELCLNKFYTHAELKYHMRKHTGEKPYECKYCKRRFSDYGAHKKHERTHTNERPFSCSICSKAFTRAFILKNHLLTHTGKRAYECTTCNKSFFNTSHLRTHFKSYSHQRCANGTALKKGDPKL